VSEEEEAPLTSPHSSRRMKEEEPCGDVDPPTSWRHEGGGAVRLKGEAANLP
jgi:hypothetical protein